MARTNTGSTSNYITAVPPTLPLPLTLACWFRPADLTSNQNLLALLNGTTTEYSVLTFDGANANGQGDNVVLAISGSGSEAFGVSGVYRGPTGQWIHCAAVFSSTTSRAAYLQGSRGAIETTSKTAAASDFITFGAYNNNAGGIFSPLNGAIAEAGIWDVALTDDEIYKLSRPGTKPTEIRPQSLRIYRSLDANESLPRGGIGLTGLAMTGTMGVASQPFPPKQNNKKHVQFIKAPAAGGGGFFARHYYDMIGHLSNV